MPIVGDVVAITLVQELSGVQMANKVYLRIDDLGTDPALAFALNQIMVEYHSRIKTSLSPAWSLVCGIYENLTSIESKAINFVNLVGTSLADSHPQDQVIRINRYSTSVAPANGSLRVAAFNQSGVAEDLSTRGRVNDKGEFDALLNWLDVQLLYGTEWLTTPQNRNRIELVKPFTYQFNRVDQALLNPKFFKLRSRKTNLCLA